MPGTTGPDINTFQIPEVQLGDTFNLWRDTTNTGIYKLNKIKVYDGVSSSSIGLTLSSGGTLSVEIADNVNKGITFNYGINFEAGVTFDGNVVFQNGVTFNGDVTFNASTFTVNANVVTIDDYAIVLGDTASASDGAIINAGGGGVLINRGTGRTASWLWSPTQRAGVTGYWSSVDSHIAISGKTYGIVPHQADLLPVYGLRLSLEGGSTTDHGFELALSNDGGVAGTTGNRKLQFTRNHPTGSTVFMEVLNGVTYGSWPYTSVYAGVNKKIVNQANTFAFGEPVYLNGSVYTSAKADNQVKAEVVGVVSRRIDANNFELTFLGEIFGDFSPITEDGSALIPGSVYYLSPYTAGRITQTVPIAAGQIHKAVMIATSTTSAIVYPFTGGILSSPINIATSSSIGVNIEQLNQFQVGDFVRWLPGSVTLTYGATSGTYPEGIYVKAQANNEADAEVAGMIIGVQDIAGNGPPTGVNGSFSVLMDGFFSGVCLPAYYGSVNSGTVYFLNTNCAGTTGSFESKTAPFSASYPIGSGRIRKPLFMATNSNESSLSGYLFSYRGDQLDLSGISGTIPLESLLIQNLGASGAVEDLRFGVRDGVGTAGGTQVMKLRGSVPGCVEIGYTATPATKGASLDVRGVIRGGRADSTQGGEIIVGRYAEGVNSSSYPETLNVFGSQYSSGNSVISYAVRPAGGTVGYESTTAINTYRAALEVGVTAANSAGMYLLTSALTNKNIGLTVGMHRLFSITDSNMHYQSATTTAPVVVFGGRTADENYARTTLSVQGDAAGGLLELGDDVGGHGIVYWDKATNTMTVDSRTSGSNLNLYGRNNINFYVNGAYRGIANSTGKWGFGTTLPQEQVHVLNTLTVAAGGHAATIAGTSGDVGSLTFTKTYSSPVASRIIMGTDGTGYKLAIGTKQGSGAQTDRFLFTDSSNLEIINPNESTALSDFTTGLSKTGIHILTEYTDGGWTPGLFWSTSDNNAGKPKAGINLKLTASGSHMAFFTSGTYSTGLTKTPLYLLCSSANSYVGINNTAPATSLDVVGTIKSDTALTLGTSTLSAPSGTAPMFAARAWADINGTASTINASGNVSSVTLLSAGRYRVNFTTAMPSASYAVIANCNLNNSSDKSNYEPFAMPYSLATTSVSINTQFHVAGVGNAQHNVAKLWVAVFA